MRIICILLSFVGISSESLAQYSGTGTFNQISSLATLTDGYYVIANGSTFAMNNSYVSSTYFDRTAISPVSGVITNPSASIVWKIETNGSGRTIYNEAGAVYASYTGTSNNIQAVTAVSGNNERWTFGYSSPVFTITNLAVTSRLLQYNASAPRFACYTGTQQNITLYKMAVTGPTLTPSPSSLSSFSYAQGSGPSTPQSFTLSGSNLTGAPGNITVSASTNYEVSLSSGSGYSTTSVSVPYSSATLASTTIYVRLKAGLSAGSYNSESIAISGGGATSSVTASGTVTPPAPANDLCANATTLVVNTAATNGTMVGATYSTVTGDQYTNYANTGNGDVWYKFIPTCSGTAALSLTTTAQDLDLYVFSTNCPSNVGSPLGSGTTTSTTSESVSSFAVTSGVTYYVRVAKYNGTSGSFTLQVTSPNVPPTITSGPTPSSASSYPGAAGTTSFTVVSAGSTFQWQYSADGTSFANVANGTPTGFTYTGATTATLNIATTTASPLNTFYYRAVATASGCPANSSNATFALVQPPTPTTTSIAPSSTTAGGGAFTLTVNGTNFVSGISTVTFNGVARTTTFVNSTQLTANILAADVATAGSVPVGVTTTGAAGTSNTQTFTINTPTVPSVAISASPSLNEATLNVATVSISLLNTTFVDAVLANGNFTLNNAPTGVSVASVTYVNSTSATLTLAYDGTDFDANVTTFNVTVAGTELTTGADITSGNLTITAVTETLSVTAGTLAFGNVCLTPPGPGSEMSFTITGSGLKSGNINVAALSGYSYSTVSGGPYASSLSLSQTGGAYSQIIYVKFSPSTATTFNGNIAVSGGAASSLSKAVTGSGINTPPTVTTGAALFITSTDASLPGSISAIGCSAISAYGIEYSTTSGFANGTGTMVVGNNLSGSNFSVAVSSLSPYTTYYYKAYATNAGGTAYGLQQSFTTSAIGTPLATAATLITGTSFTANWNAVAGATSYRLDVSTSSTFGSTILASDLFISEYVEGSGSNKYIEIYNGTGATVDLSNYSLKLYSNGSTSTTADVTLSGSLSNGSVVVYKNGSASIYGGTATSNTAVNFNGDDAIVLAKNGSNIDVIGEIGNATNYGQDVTLVRKSTVSGPSTTYVPAEFDQFAQNTISDLGNHTMNSLSPSFVLGYENLAVSGTSQAVTGLAEATTYYYRVRAFSTNSTSGNSNVISATTLCGTNTFTGTGDFSDATKWSCGVAPGAVSTYNVVIGAGADLTLNTNFEVGSGYAFTMNATSTMTINPAIIFKVTGTADFNGQAVTLKSTSAGNGTIGSSSTIANASNITIERFIPARTNRAWRVLSVPTTGSQSIMDAWQEGFQTVVGVNNKGTLITGSGANALTNGFDYKTPSGSMLTYNGVAGSLSSVPNTNSTAIATTGGYFLYVRGDRNVTPSSSITGTTQTTLRTHGGIYQGNQSFVIPDGADALVGNIYPSAIDLRQLTLGSAVENNFAVWDPALEGTYGLGGYQTFTWNSGTNTYDITPVVTPAVGGSYDATGFRIQPGQAFFATAGSGTAAERTISFTESAKTDQGSNYNVFSPPAPSKRLITNLFAIVGDNRKIADGTLQIFQDDFSNNVDALDAKKRYNFGENFYIVKNQKDLVVEKRQPLVATDTIYFGMEKLKGKFYDLEINAQYLDDANLVAFLEDKYTQERTPLNLNGITTVRFAIDGSNAASTAVDRFRIVFGANVVLAITGPDVYAYRKQDKVTVEWNMADQKDVQQYEVEKSTNGSTFYQTAIVQPNAAGNYTWIDDQPASGNNFYRVIVRGKDGNGAFSKIAQVKFDGRINPLQVYPNPITTNEITLRVDGSMPGTYGARLLSINGTTLYRSQFSYAGGNTAIKLNVGNIVNKGKYYLEIVHPDKSITVEPVLFIK